MRNPAIPHPRINSGFPIFSSGGHFVHQNKTVLTILLEDHLSNIPMILK